MSKEEVKVTLNWSTKLHKSFSFNYTVFKKLFCTHCYARNIENNLARVQVLFQSLVYLFLFLFLLIGFSDKMYSSHHTE